MDEFNKIRKAFYDDGNTINEIAIKFKRSWATVDRIVKSSRDDCLINKKNTRTPRVSSQDVRDAIANKLLEEKKLRVKKKQRLTAKKIYEELIQSGVYNGSIRRMQELVKEVRDQLVQTQPESYLPLEFALGSTAQVDHGEVECIIEDDRRVHYLFVMSIPGTTLRYCQMFATKAQEAWGEFHERAFQFFNGMFPRVIYDNDTVLVKDLKEDKRLLTEFTLHLIEHYGFETTFCNPASGNEKGSVENAVGYCRRNYLNGCPVFASTQEANSYLEEQCRATIEHSVHYRSGKPLTGIRNELENKLQPLLPSKMWRRWVKRQVNHYQLIEVDGHRYSAPEKFVLAYLRIGIGAEVIDLYDGSVLVTSHKRQFIVGKDSLFLDHYLGQLCRKPGALWDCKAVQECTKDELLLALWKKLMTHFPALKDHEEKVRYAQKCFIDVLMLRRRYKEEEWRSGISKALECGSTSAVSIECIIRGVLMPETVGDSNVTRKILSIDTWNCDLSSYITLLDLEGVC